MRKPAKKINGHIPGAPAATPAAQLSVEDRLNIARAIITRTCEQTGAGFCLIMFIPGTDRVMRAFRGVDTKAEGIAVVADVAAMFKEHFERAEPPKQPTAQPPNA